MAMFLKDDDFKSAFDDFELEQFEANTAKRLSAERSALEKIAGYLRGRYDVNKAYSATGDDRNPMLVECAVNITIWLMGHRLPDNMGGDKRKDLYDDSIKWLKDIQAGKAKPDLPTYVSEDGSDTDTANPIKWGSQKKTQNTW